jgi:hypothetical protein
MLPPPAANRFDRQHRRDDAHPRFFCFELQLITPVEPGNVRARSPHVETDRFFESGPLRHAGKANDSTGRSGEDAVFSDKAIGIRQPPGGGH